jgi:hypothetical protein
MKLRYEVSPSEAGTVVDGLRAEGHDATLANRSLGSETDMVLVSDVDQADADAIDELVSDLDTSASRLQAGS